MRYQEESSWGRRAGVVLLVVLAGLFSFLNAGERVTLNLGFTVFYRISLVGLVFSVFLLGMVAMFLFTLSHDRRVRELLRSYQREYPTPRDGTGGAREEAAAPRKESTSTPPPDPEPHPDPY